MLPPFLFIVAFLNASIIHAYFRVEWTIGAGFVIIQNHSFLWIFCIVRAIYLETMELQEW